MEIWTFMFIHGTHAYVRSINLAIHTRTCMYRPEKLQLTTESI